MGRRRVTFAIRAGLVFPVAAACVIGVPIAATDGPPAEPPAAASARPLTVLTYNIEGARHTPHALARILDLLKRRAPDIVCLQEVAGLTASKPTPHAGRRPSGQAATIADALGGYDWRAAFRDAAAGPVVMVRGTIIRHQTLALPGGRPYAVLVEADIDGRRMIVVSVHLQSLSGATPLGAMNTEPQRVTQVRRLLHRLARESLPVVLAGDFNALPLFPSYVLMTQRFRDVAALFEDVSYTRKTLGLPARIDYVFIADPFIARSYAVLPVDHSDHRPVIAIVGLPDSLRRR